MFDLFKKKKQQPRYEMTIKLKTQEDLVDIMHPFTCPGDLIPGEKKRSIDCPLGECDKCRKDFAVKHIVDIERKPVPMTIEQAKEYLKENTHCAFHDYIDQTLAGDFATEMALTFKQGRRKR